MNNKNDIKRVLILGKSSYIGNSFTDYVSESEFVIDSVSLQETRPDEIEFASYDSVIYLSAIVHQKNAMEHEYYIVNRDLAVECARLAKNAGVNHFIYLSTMAVYGLEGGLFRDQIITMETLPNPKTAYAKSKLEAEMSLKLLANVSFAVCIIRPPMVYGENCPGNYLKLYDFAKRFRVFPLLKHNRRGMLNITKLCELLKSIILNKCDGLFLPQDDKLIDVYDLVKTAGSISGWRLFLSLIAGIPMVMLYPLKRQLLSKIYGSLYYR